MLDILLTQYEGAILGPIAKVLGVILNVLFNFLSSFGILNAGLCIILFTFIVKSLMIPLTIKQQKFTKLSSKMNPELTKIQAKYKNKKDQESIQKQQLEMQALYQKYGVSPTSGCLPMLITLPIFFALYRVIYNIPAYVDKIYAIYESIAKGIITVPGYEKILTDYVESAQVMVKFNAEAGINNVIDIMSQFNQAKWNDFIALFNQTPDIAKLITDNSTQIMDINRFFGSLNIAEISGTKFPGVLVPILATVTQFIQTKQMTVSNPTDPNSSGANMMKSMNTFMPIFSGFMCLMMPIGVGLYWVAGSVFQIIQQFFIDRHMDKVDVEELIAKNNEKSRKKKIRLGLDPDQSFEDLAKKSTRSVPGRTTASIAEKSKISVNAVNTNNKNVKNDSVNKSQNVSHKSSSIAANANLLKRNNGNKED